jgi:hypothetical protein
MQKNLQRYADNHLKNPASLATLPALFAEAGEGTAYHFVGFSTAGIVNDCTPKAYIPG